MSITVKVDASDLERWARQLTSGKKLASAIAGGLNAAGGKARTSFIRDAAADLNISSTDVRKGVSELSRANAMSGKLSVEFRATNTRMGILVAKGARVVKGDGLTSVQFRSTGGGSSHLQIRRAFVNKKGNVVFRVGKGRFPLKTVFASGAAAEAKQPNSYAMKAWKQYVVTAVPDETGKRVDAALKGSS